MLLVRWPLMQEAAGDAGSAGAAGGASTGTAGTDQAAAGAQTASEGSLLGDAAKGGKTGTEDNAAVAGAKTITPSIDPNTGRPSHIPEKFWDAQAKSLRSDDLVKAYAGLEKRVGSLGMPPESIDGYSFKPPEGQPSLDPAGEKAFKEEALKLGLTQKQYEGVIGKYITATASAIPEAIASFVEGRRAVTEQTLKAQWGAEYETNMGAALAAFNAFTADEEKAEVDRIGNNPVMLRILARVGKELGEDKTVRGAENLLGQEDLKFLMRGSPGKEDSPYWNASDPNHARTKAKVQQHHEAIARQRAVREAA